MDGLTGLPARREFEAHLETRPRGFGVAFDVDGLIWLNDEQGYAPADAVLVSLAHLVEAHARAASGRAFRIGGDEFIVCLDESRGHADALALARAVVGAVRELALPYARRDQPSRRHVALNAVVCRLDEPALRTGRRAEWIAEKIWNAKGRDPFRFEVVGDATS